MLDQIKRAASILQAAALGQEPSSFALEHLSRLVGGDGAGFVNWNGLANGSQPLEVYNCPPEMLADYVTSFAHRDIQVEAIFRKWGTSPPPVFLDDEVLPRQALLRSEIYNEFWIPNGIHHNVVLEGSPQPHFGVTRMRVLIGRGAGKPGFGESEKRILAALSPHFETAATLFAQRRAQANAAIAQVFESAADATAIIEASGKLCYSNAAFDVLRRSVDPLWHRYYSTPLDSPGFVPLRSEFHAALAECRHADFCARHFKAQLRGMSGPPILVTGFVTAALASSGVKNRNRQTQFLLVVRRVGVREQERTHFLQRQYLLTPAEVRVLQHFADGKALSVIAATLGVTVHTVRLHMKSLLGKTGCRRQAELMRLIERTPIIGFRFET